MFKLRMIILKKKVTTLTQPGKGRLVFCHSAIEEASVWRRPFSMKQLVSRETQTTSRARPGQAKRRSLIQTTMLIALMWRLDGRF